MSRPRQTRGGATAMAQARSVPGPMMQEWALTILLIAAVILAYQPAWHAGFIWDDDVYVTSNPLLTAPDGLRRIWFSFDSPSQYFPFIYTTLRLEHALWGFNAAGYHWVNILMQCADALLLRRLLTELKIPGAWFAAAIFALHPVQAESVAWITELKNVQMGLFYFLTLLAWRRYTDAEAGQCWRFYVLALGLYALALFSKTTACTLPVILLMLEWWRTGRVTRHGFLETVPFFGLGVGMGSLTIWWERFHQGTQGPRFAMGIFRRLLIAGRACWFYLFKLVWPAKMTFSYPHWDISPDNLIDWIWPVALCGLAAWLWFDRGRLGRGAFAALAIFVVTLGPVSGLVMLYTFRYTYVADHYQYIACIGPIVVFAAAMERIRERAELWIYKAGPGFGVAILLILAMQTHADVAAYQNLGTLWLDTIRKNPDSSLGHNNYGDVLLRRGMDDAAMEQYNEALKSDPDDWEALTNRGAELLNHGQRDAAIADFQHSIQAWPAYDAAHDNLGVALFQAGNFNGAMAEYTEALRDTPNYADAHNNLGILLAQMGQTDEAIVHYREALRLNPDFADAHVDFGNALLSQSKLPEAIREYRAALSSKPGFASAEFDLSTALARNGDMAGAIAAGSEAVRLQPDSAQFKVGLAWMLATAPQTALRDGPRAVDLMKSAMTAVHGIDPGALRYLAAAYAQAGNFASAVASAQAALKNTDRAGVLGKNLLREIALYQAGEAFAEGPATSSAR